MIVSGQGLSSTRSLPGFLYQETFRENQVTVTRADLDAGWHFYCTLGLKPFVDARTRYARFVCPDGDSTFSLHRGANGGGGTSIYFECENLDDTVSNLKEAGLGFVSSPEDKS